MEHCPPGEHEFVETALFIGRFCASCGCDEDDLDANPHAITPRGVALP